MPSTSFGVERGEEALSYGGYLKVPELLALQVLRSEPAQHDETLFIVIHQVYELWFKQLLHELDALLRHLERDEVLAAVRLLRRCIEIQRVLVAQIGVLETMTPMDFLAFRDHVTPASGFQSVQFRELESVSGIKDAKFLRAPGLSDEERARLRARLEGASLPEVLEALLARRGFRLPAYTPDDDEAAREAKHRQRVGELMRVYREAERDYPLFLLAEALVEYDENFQLWRFRHVQMVERVIGARPGTGGSEGAAYLRTTLGRRFFPELWELRGYLGVPGSPGPGSAERPIAAAAPGPVWYGEEETPNPSPAGPAGGGDEPGAEGGMRGCPMGH
jgi:tryptophan 2,3-dioxygenase